MLTKEQLQKLIGVEILVNSNGFGFTIFSLEDESMTVRWNNVSFYSNIKYLYFNNTLLPMISMYVSDETDEVMLVKDFIKVVD